MASHTFFALFSSAFLEFFASNRDIDGWEDIALSWIVVAVVISVVCWGLMILIKWLRKRSARVIRDQAWSRTQSIVFVLIGLAPVLAITVVVYFVTRDFENVIGIPGLAKGVLFAWGLYIVLMLASHAAGPWKRDLY
jgi:magnesium-transporting ATPase (P-type)